MSVLTQFLLSRLLPLLMSICSLHLLTPLLLPCIVQTSLTKEVSLPGMMTAITEVEVSKEDKMRKIEETERIKHAMLLKKTGRCVGDVAQAVNMLWA